MTKINFQNLPDTTTPVNATNLNQLQTNVENEINEVNKLLLNVNSTALGETTGVTTGSLVLETTITDAGVYLFNAMVPLNYYGQSGRELYCKLYINNNVIARCGGIINLNAYLVYSPIIIMTGVAANSVIKMMVEDVTGKSYSCPQFTLQYLKLR